MQFLTVTGYTINSEDIRLVEWNSSGTGCTIYLRPSEATNQGGPNQIELTAAEAKGLQQHFRQLATLGQAVDLTAEGGQTNRPTRAARGAGA
jgi:hypothetical protein